MTEKRRHLEEHLSRVANGLMSHPERDVRDIAIWTSILILELSEANERIDQLESNDD